MGYYIYKSLQVEEKNNGLVQLCGLKDKDILSEIIPDAVEFVKKNNYKLGARLYDLNGVDLYIFPSMSVEMVKEEWMQEHFKITGIDM